jgi:BlaI family transcriptional regulator, penicillinase repressor
MKDLTDLTKRERQIMEIIYSRGEASATDVMTDMTDPLTRSAVRTFLRILEDKGHLTHVKQGKEFIYKPVRPRGQMARSALRRVLSTFFSGSIEQAVAMHLADPGAQLSAAELARLKQLVKQAKQKGE